MSKITHAEVRMYRLGTGDCFAIKFFAGLEVTCKIMIDAGTWSGSADQLEPYITDLKHYLEDYADILIITHEHKDHVHAFDACEHLFTDGKFEVGEIWMGWTENDKIKKVKEWKKQYGEKKKALGVASKKLEDAMLSPEYQSQFTGSKDASRMLGARKTFSNVLNGFAQLHLSLDSTTNLYKGGLAGMDVVKNKIKKTKINYFKPGDIINDIAESEGIKIYVLGPPQLYADVKKESGKAGESYQHNKVLKESDAFGAAVLSQDQAFIHSSVWPFDLHYSGSYHGPSMPGSREEAAAQDEQNKLEAVKTAYRSKEWRKIDFDWLYSAGSFALRMNSLTNNLSLALAIEFEDTGRVMLFPGDAEFGSWSSWHKIDWKEEARSSTDKTAENKKEQKHLTEDLLNRTVFYKVAHHLSHNGTAQELGLEMMKHKDLVAMATLDYNVINSGWTSTMPNRAILKELLYRTKGRLMVMNDEGLFFDFNEEVPLKEKIEEARDRMSSKEKKAFEENFEATELYLQYVVKA